MFYLAFTSTITTCYQLKIFVKPHLRVDTVYLENRTPLTSMPGVALLAQQFEVSTILAGKTVDVRYNHFDLSEVFIYLDGRLIQKARAATLPRWNTATKQPIKSSPKPQKSNIQHLAYLQQQHHQSQVQHARQLVGEQPPKQTPYHLSRFCKEVAAALGRKLENFHATDRASLAAIWSFQTQFGPYRAGKSHP